MYTTGGIQATAAEQAQTSQHKCYNYCQCCCGEIAAGVYTHVYTASNTHAAPAVYVQAQTFQLLPAYCGLIFARVYTHVYTTSNTNAALAVHGQKLMRHCVCVDKQALTT